MIDRYELAQLLAEIAQMLELSGENTFKVRAYQNAARTVEQLDSSLTDPDAEAKLAGIKGIGPALGDKIREYIATGRITYYEELKSSLSPVLFELLKLPGLGPKKALALHKQLGVHSLGELEYACRENRLVSLTGFGTKTQERILQGIEYMKKFQGQFILGDAWLVADLIVEYIKLQPGVEQAAAVGSIRRGLEVVRDIEIVAASSSPDSLAAGLTDMQGVDHVVSREANKLTVSLLNGLICTVYIVGPDEYWTALAYYTGSDGYIAKMTEQAARQGLTFNSAGVKTQAGEQVAVKDEHSLYSLFKLSYAEPESREDETELKPIGADTESLVALADIRGVFHVHTNYSDGAGSLADMAAAARQRGWQYLGIADHSQTAVYARGLRTETVMAQRREIDKLNAAHPDFTILTGIESDILPDGSLDYPDEVLASFDFVVASVHSAFRQSEADMTRRIVRAVRNRYVTMLGHPTGRILLGRKGYAVNLPEVIQAAVQSGTMIEINASPYRLDLDWRWCRTAKEQGIVFAINPDAHAVSEFEHMRYGLAVARKAGLTAGDIVNTCAYPEVVGLLQRKRQKP
ncbi:DNA polymerase/3'-5' exonuclease PolX [Sporomusa sp.]|uniref:DNA polymerase/3'-5' exonuclease PolX n=1 Tax=Sporomusa sp. TaxID=2078658 RepID=UPI002D120623|nr:DNA polymerase/3'-5' exonuclease PolX [Sporomusa sp.]HWR42751.1 DNA polymerase/3'-5' exonuclease PolX [Sporomusa sp.]